MRTFLASLTLLVLSIALAPRASAQVPASADELFERYIEAIGGREAADAHGNRVLYGMVTMPGGEQHRLLTLWFAKPDKMRYELQMPGLASAVRAYDGETVWGFDEPNPARLIDPESEEGKDLRQGSAFLGEVAYREAYPTRDLVGETRFEGKAVWEVKVTTAVGFDRRVFFDQETGLINGWQTMRDRGGTPVPVVQILDKYEEHGGVLFPMRQVQREIRSTGPIDTVVEYQHVRMDQENMPEFSPPASMAAANGG